MKKYKIGLIGLGARAESFARQLYAGSERYELFGVCDIDASRMDIFCDYCGLRNVRKDSDPEHFFSEKDMDAVIITTPDFCHLETARLAFKANKHVYLDKPLEVTSEKCREIIRLHKASTVTAFVGFNMRASQHLIQAKEIVQCGTLGKMIHIEGLEQLHVTHGASFMRRYHRKLSQSGGLLNTKSSHDMDIMQWLVGHEHKIRRVCSFGGVNIFKPNKDKPLHCRDCRDECRYRDCAGFVFPIGNDKPFHKDRDTNIYGGDLCVYNSEKELIDNQTIIMEWDNGVRGNFNLQLFQQAGKRETKIWFENGLLTTGINGALRVTRSDNGAEAVYEFKPRPGGHGGTDPMMLTRFINAIEGEKSMNSGLAEGLAATLIAEKANESMDTGKIIEISPEEYDI